MLPGLKLIGIWEPAAIAAGPRRSFGCDQVRRVVLAVCRGLVIAREERYLRLRFGAEYEAYCRSVRRWL